MKMPTLKKEKYLFDWLRVGGGLYFGSCKVRAAGWVSFRGPKTCEWV